MEKRVSREVESEYMLELFMTLYYSTKRKRTIFVKRIHTVLKQINQMHMQGQQYKFLVF